MGLPSANTPTGTYIALTAWTPSQRLPGTRRRRSWQIRWRRLARRAQWLAMMFQGCQWPQVIHKRETHLSYPWARDKFPGQGTSLRCTCRSHDSRTGWTRHHPNNKTNQSQSPWAEKLWSVQGREPAQTVAWPDTRAFCQHRSSYPPRRTRRGLFSRGAQQLHVLCMSNLRNRIVWGPWWDICLEVE